MRYAHLPLLLLLGACTVGPDYIRPQLAATAGATRFVRADDTSQPDGPAVAAWWRSFRDPILDTLEEKARTANADVEIATARLQQARAGLRLERANARPNANVQALYLHGELPPTNLGAIGSSDETNGGGQEATRTSLDFYNAGFDASWEVDLFGGKRRAREAAAAAAEAYSADLDDVRVTLSAEIAQAYINLRDVQARLDLAQASARLQREMLVLLRQRAAAGTATRGEVAQLVGDVENTDANVTPLTAQRDAYLNNLAVLVGEAPGALDALLTPIRPVPLPPPAVVVGNPARLLSRRPDVRSAERTLAAQTAKIGVAEAARFPKLSFMGVIGLGGSDPGDVFDLSNVSALALPRLTWNVLDFGRNNARIDQQTSVRDEALGRYRRAVLGALQDAEDSLGRFGSRRLVVASAARADQAAIQASSLAQQNYRAGTLRRGDWLNAERQRLSAAQALSQSTAAMSNDFVALQKSLGLGWAASDGTDTSMATVGNGS